MSVDIISEQHRSDLFDSMFRLYQEQQQCDITLITADGEPENATSGGMHAANLPANQDPSSSTPVNLGSRRRVNSHTRNESQEANTSVVECHKFVLAAASGYFRAILFSDAQPNIIDISPLHVDTAKQAVRFIYSGTCTINQMNALDMYEISQTWELHSLEVEVSQYLANTLSVENAIQVYVSSAQRGNEVFKQTVSSYVREHFDEIIKTKSTNLLRYDQLHRFLDMDEIKVTSEDDIFTCVAEWITANRGYKRSDRLWELVKFDRLSKEFLCQVVIDHPMMKEPPQKYFVRAAMQILYKPASELRLSSPRYWRQKYFSGRLGKVSRERELYILDIGSSQWKRMCSVPQWVANNCLVSAAPSGVFITNPDKDNRNLFINFSTPTSTSSINIHHTWRIASQMFDGCKIMFFMHFSDDDGTDVVPTQVDMRENTWDYLQPLPVFTQMPVVVSNEMVLMVIGGWSRGLDDYHIHHTQIFNKDNKTWSLGQPCPEHCFGNNTGFLHNNHVNIFTSKYYMSYNIEDDLWTHKKYSTIGSVHSAFWCDGRDMAIVCVLTEGRATLMAYDQQANTWSTVANVDVSDCIGYSWLFQC